MVQRAFKMREQVHLQFGNRPCRWIKAHSSATSPFAQENSEIQQEAFVQTAEIGEYFYCTQVYRKREHSVGEYR